MAMKLRRDEQIISCQLSTKSAFPGMKIWYLCVTKVLSVQPIVEAKLAEHNQFNTQLCVYGYTRYSVFTISHIRAKINQLTCGIDSKENNSRLGLGKW